MKLRCESFTTAIPALSPPPFWQGRLQKSALFQLTTLFSEDDRAIPQPELKLMSLACAVQPRQETRQTPFCAPWARQPTIELRRQFSSQIAEPYSRHTSAWRMSR